jgi:hypothetical protein
MINLDCYSARGINITIGIFLLVLGLFLVALGLTVLPVLGFILAVPAIVLAVFFFSAPRDKTCFIFGKGGVDSQSSPEKYGGISDNERA